MAVIGPVYVNPNATGGLQDGSSPANGYLSLNACLTAEATSISAGDEFVIERLTENSVKDTTEATITSSWQTATGAKLTISAYTGNFAVKTGIDESKYLLEVTDPGVACLLVNDPNNSGEIEINGLQIRAVYSASSFRSGLRVSDSGDGSVIVNGCYIDGPDDSSSGYAGLANYGVNNLRFTNNVVRNFDEVGMRLDGYAEAYNNIIEGTTGDGIFINTGTTGYLKNNASFNNNDDFDNRGSMTLDYNASDDGDGSNPVTPADWDAVYEDILNGDFTLLSGSDLVGAGVGPDTDSLVPTTDIDGDTRSGTTTDIGADLYVASGGITVTGTDTMSISDSASIAIGLSTTGADSLTLADTATAAIFLTLTATDNTVFTDVGITSISILVSGLDSMGLGDFGSSGESIPITGSDVLYLADSASVQISIDVSGSDTLILSDVASVNLSVSVNGSDSISLSEIESIIHNLDLSGSDALLLGDVAQSSGVIAGILRLAISALSSRTIITAQESNTIVTVRKI